MSGMNSRARNKILDKYSKGELFVCELCVRNVYRNIEPKAIVDHRDNNPQNNDPENHQILCRSCNRKKNPKRHRARSIHTQSEKTNARAEGPWRDWVINKIMHEPGGGYPIDEAIFSGAELFNVSPDTIDRRWLPKLTSTAGKYTEDQGKLYHKGFESQKKANLTQPTIDHKPASLSKHGDIS